jgi:hypothetical protein
MRVTGGNGEHIDEFEDENLRECPAQVRDAFLCVSKDTLGDDFWGKPTLQAESCKFLQ